MVRTNWIHFDFTSQVTLKCQTEYFQCKFVCQHTNITRHVPFNCQNLHDTVSCFVFTTEALGSVKTKHLGVFLVRVKFWSSPSFLLPFKQKTNIVSILNPFLREEQKVLFPLILVVTPHHMTPKEVEVWAIFYSSMKVNGIPLLEENPKLVIDMSFGTFFSLQAAEVKSEGLSFFNVFNFSSATRGHFRNVTTPFTSMDHWSKKFFERLCIRNFIKRNVQLLSFIIMSFRIFWLIIQ